MVTYSGHEQTLKQLSNIYQIICCSPLNWKKCISESLKKWLHKYFKRWWQWFLSAIPNRCLTFLHGHSSKSKWITVMKVNKWNQIKQGHTSLEGQQMGTEMEVIFFSPLCLNKNGEKSHQLWSKSKLSFCLKHR